MVVIRRITCELCNFLPSYPREEGWASINIKLPYCIDGQYEHIIHVCPHCIENSGVIGKLLKALVKHDGFKEELLEAK